MFGSYGGSHQVLQKPVPSGTGRDLKPSPRVGVEVAARYKNEFLRMRGRLIGLAGQLAGNQRSFGATTMSSGVGEIRLMYSPGS